MEPPGWAVQHTPADAAQGTIGKAADALGIHIVRHITVSVSGAANAAAAPVVFVLRDSTTGAGNILWTAKLCNILNESASLSAAVNIPGLQNQAMTLESAAAPVSSSRVTVSMDGYTDRRAV